jgi:hypothetical protein
MAKPSVTNIRPPSKSPDPIWTPPKTSWDLNAAADIDAAGAFYGDHSTGGEQAQFDSLTNSINTTEASDRDDVTAADMQGGNATDGWNYDYVFFGVNGGEDETVVGKLNASGIIVTGNGKDTITGGNLGDLIFSGNGKDLVHGGGGNDIIFGENGADDLHGDSDDGTAAVTTGQGEEVLVVNEDADLWDHDPNGGSEAATTPNNTTVSKEGVYIAVDEDGHPTELDGGGNPVVHVVYSVTPATSGFYTLAYTRGNGLDGLGDPDFAGPSDQQQVELVAGNTYYYSFTYDPGHSTVRVDVFAGQITVTSPINDGPGGNPSSVATSQALPTADWSDFFHTETVAGEPELTDFTAGDELIGGNGPDTFVWDAADLNNVDLIWDFNQGSGVYDEFEGDKLVLNGIQDTNGDDVVDVNDLTVFTDVDLDGDGSLGLVIYVGENQAIGLAGITDISQVTLELAVA